MEKDYCLCEQDQSSKSFCARLPRVTAAARQWVGGLSPVCVFFPEPGLKKLQTQGVAQDSLITPGFVKMLQHQQG